MTRGRPFCWRDQSVFGPTSSMSSGRLARMNTGLTPNSRQTRGEAFGRFPGPPGVGEAWSQEVRLTSGPLASCGDSWNRAFWVDRVWSAVERMWDSTPGQVGLTQLLAALQGAGCWGARCCPRGLKSEPGRVGDTALVVGLFLKWGPGEPPGGGWCPSEYHGPWPPLPALMDPEQASALRFCDLKGALMVDTGS